MRPSVGASVPGTPSTDSPKRPLDVPLRSRRCRRNGPTVCHQRGEQRPRDLPLARPPGVSPCCQRLTWSAGTRDSPQRRHRYSSRIEAGTYWRPANSGLVPRREMSCAGWRDRSVKVAGPSASNGGVGARGLRLRGWPIRSGGTGRGSLCGMPCAPGCSRAGVGWFAGY